MNCNDKIFSNSADLEHTNPNSVRFESSSIENAPFCRAKNTKANSTCVDLAHANLNSGEITNINDAKLENFIAIDTSGAHLSVAAVKNGKTTLYYQENCMQKHSVVLMPALEQTLKKADMNLNDADFFAAVVGPGSFTGIRIGIATIKGLAFSLNKPVICVTAFDLLAYNVEKERIAAVIDAMHGNYYVCLFEQNNKNNPQFINLKELEKISENHFIVSGAQIDGIQTHIVSPDKNLAPAVQKLSSNKIPAEHLKALYIRKSQAEENR